MNIKFARGFAGAYIGESRPSGLTLCKRQGSMANSNGPRRAHFDGVTRPPVLNAPPVVTALIIVMIGLYFLLGLLPDSIAARVEYFGAVSPRRFTSNEQTFLIAAVNVFSLFTHALLHAGIGHVGLNSVWLLAFGAPVARAFNSVACGRGARPFLSFFFLSSAVGALVYIAMHPEDPTLLVGASGGVSGLLGGLVRFAFRRPYGGEASPFSGLVSRPVVMWTAVIVGLNLAVGLGGALVSPDLARIAWEAHIGGYLFGLLSFPAAIRLANRPRGC